MKRTAIFAIAVVGLFGLPLIGEESNDETQTPIIEAAEIQEEKFLSYSDQEETKENQYSLKESEEENTENFIATSDSDEEKSKEEAFI